MLYFNALYKHCKDHPSSKQLLTGTIQKFTICDYQSTTRRRQQWNNCGFGEDETVTAHRYVNIKWFVSITLRVLLLSSNQSHFDEVGLGNPKQWVLTPAINKVKWSSLITPWWRRICLVLQLTNENSGTNMEKESRGGSENPTVFWFYSKTLSLSMEEWLSRPNHWQHLGTIERHLTDQL